jgi:hypothetical protein
MTQITNDVLADITQRIVEVAKPDKLMLSFHTRGTMKKCKYARAMNGCFIRR